MKKLTVLSIVAASILLVGCNESSTGAEAKASKEAPVHEAKTEMKCSSGKCGGDMKKAATEKVAEVKHAVAEKAEEAKTAVAEKAEEVKNAVAEKAEEAKTAVAEKAAAATAAVTGAVAAATGGADSAKGKALYAKCGGCHGADGKTKAMGKSEVIAGQAAADLETKIAEYKAGTRNVAGMGMIMKGQVGSMSDEDIKAISAYISGL